MDRQNCYAEDRVVTPADDDARVDQAPPSADCVYCNGPETD